MLAVYLSGNHYVFEEMVHLIPHTLDAKFGPYFLTLRGINTTCTLTYVINRVTIKRELQQLRMRTEYSGKVQLFTRCTFLFGIASSLKHPSNVKFILCSFWAYLYGLVNYMRNAQSKIIYSNLQLESAAQVRTC